jgi:type I restriction-modification system DNA methylase subunit
MTNHDKHGFSFEPMGDIFMEFASSSRMGQFFTPYNVSYMMAQMTMDSERETVADNAGC